MAYNDLPEIRFEFYYLLGSDLAMWKRQLHFDIFLKFAFFGTLWLLFFCHMVELTGSLHLLSWKYSLVNRDIEQRQELLREKTKISIKSNPNWVHSKIFLLVLFKINKKWVPCFPLSLLDIIEFLSLVSLSFRVGQFCSDLIVYERCFG